MTRWMISPGLMAGAAWATEEIRVATQQHEARMSDFFMRKRWLELKRGLENVTSGRHVIFQIAPRTFWFTISRAELERF